MKSKRLFPWGIYLLLFLLYAGELYGTTKKRLPDIQSMGTGGNGVTQTACINPALLPLSTNNTLYFQYYNPYELSELGTLSGIFIYPNKWLSAGLHFSSFGYDKYRETMFRFVAGKQLSEQWALGIGVQYVVLQTELYDEQPSRLATDIGVLFSPSDSWQIGLAVLNTPSVSIGDQVADQLTPFSVQVGFSWQVFDHTTLYGSLITTEKTALSTEAGIAYTAFKSFYFRAGIQSDPLVPCLGMGYTYRLFTVDVATVFHPVLGVSTGVGLTVSF